MSTEVDLRARIKQIIAAQLRVSPEALSDDLSVEATGLNSLALAEAVVAIEQQLGKRVDTAKLSEQLSYELTLAQLMDTINSALE
jgi:acyl carrier protein